MLETQRPWSGGEQRKNLVGLGTYEIPFFFLYIWIYVCCWLRGSVGGDVHSEQAVSGVWFSLEFTVFIYSQHIDHGMNTNF